MRGICLFPNFCFTPSPIIFVLVVLVVGCVSVRVGLVVCLIWQLWNMSCLEHGLFLILVSRLLSTCEVARASTRHLPTLHVRFVLFAKLPSTTMEIVLEKVRKNCVTRRVRIEEFMKTFDKNKIKKVWFCSKDRDPDPNDNRLT